MKTTTQPFIVTSSLVPEEDEVDWGRVCVGFFGDEHGLVRMIVARADVLPGGVAEEYPTLGHLRPYGYASYVMSSW